MTPAVDLVVVSSPLQVLNAIEWRRRDVDAPADLVLLGDRAGGRDAALALLKREPGLWRKILEHPGRPRPAGWLPAFGRDVLDAGHRASLERLAAQLGPRRTLVFGDYRNVSQRALAAAVAHEELILLDDGSVAPQVAAARAGLAAPAPERFRPGWLRTELGRRTLGERAPAAPPRLAFFTIYEPLMRGRLAGSDRIVPHSYEGWRAAAASAGRGDEVWVLGSNHAEAGICSGEDYARVVLAGLAALRAEGRPGPFLYRPHRGEDKAKAAALARAGGMELAEDGAPAELAYLEARRRPAAVLVVASSAADTLSVLDPGLEILRVALPANYLRRQRDHILAVVAGHDAFNPRLRLIGAPEDQAGGRPV
ncbi:hypothetical protein [Hansschlegelia beijingensis]|uniref:Uncharacterized protein n=1 Tax=Hansschlegelia beijingensis TaxID=1133344 RepID=A0A7W6D7R4_9HYPH|nr:hypothetical protein [Hansschlegelia beijingensis]MBB3973784.1 hypothetical protein [Hansschlegelia beijingensis]